ncbi:MAG: MFS transporter [Clostridia bacterium]|nr:MFS transporter [Clostridia bacterium]
MTNKHFHKLNSYTHTITACLCGSFIQAITLNFAPLLFLTFRSQYGVSLGKVGFLVTLNFGIQLFIDLIFSKLADRVSQRLSLVLAHVLSAVGLISLAFLPDMIDNAYTGLVISVVIYAIGGGLLEVTVSPIVEACPTKRKSATMALLHSFYCWGYVLTVLLSTLFFFVFGIENWKYMSLIWAVIPALNTVYLLFVPMPDQEKGSGEKMEYKVLFRNKIFWLMLVMMICSGAAEQGICQWVSTFVEAGLGVSKVVGDLTGPLLFALFMGFSRIIYAKFSEKIDLRRYLFVSVLLCAVSYLCISLVPNPVIALIACSVCGFACGIFWPGTLSLAAGSIPKGGGMMFALLALGGDLGCTAGPTIISAVSSSFGDNLKKGFLVAAVFPIVMIILLLVSSRNKMKSI